MMDSKIKAVKSRQIIWLSIVIMIVIILTSNINFLFFKHIEQRHVDELKHHHAEQLQKIKKIITAQRANRVPLVNTQPSPPARVAPTSTRNDEGSGENNVAARSDVPQTVTMQVVTDETGANNPIYQQALRLMRLYRYDKAIALLINNNLLLKTHGLSALLLARIYLTMNQYGLAEAVLEHALSLHAGAEIDLLSLRAQTAFIQGHYQKTIDLLSSQSPDLSHFPRYYALLAEAYMHLNQAHNAISIFQQIVQLFPNSANYWLGLAVAYQKTGDANSAIVAYRRSAQLSQHDPQVSLFINQQLQALHAT